MYRNSNSADSQLNKVMTNEQFNQVVDAILSGKYSWACLLILRFSGYNPLHYIPYRTYNRLMKTNSSSEKQPVDMTAKLKGSKAKADQEKNSRQLQDLYYLEDADHQSAEIKGGTKAIATHKMITRLFS
ncbi:MAG: HetP family heterocyst commitment protein [Cyanobacteria bacterium J06600_6]